MRGHVELFSQLYKHEYMHTCMFQGTACRQFFCDPENTDAQYLSRKVCEYLFRIGLSLLMMVYSLFQYMYLQNKLTPPRCHGLHDHSTP